MKRIFNCFIVMIIAFSTVTFGFAQSTSAEKYSYKGAAYASKLTTNNGQTYNTNSSMVIVAASANYANPSGKANVHVYSRCEVVKNYTGARSCFVDELTARFGTSTSTGADYRVDNFIQKVVPAPTPTKSRLSPLTYYIPSTPINGTLYTIDVLINTAYAKVAHSWAQNDYGVRVSFKNPDLSQVDVPTTTKYSEVLAKHPNKGMYANYAFQYTNAKYTPVTAKASAVYSITINTGAISPLVLRATTPDAVLPFTIGI